jgi:hypothetical protein
MHTMHRAPSLSVLVLAMAVFGCESRETSLRAIGAVDELPLAPSAADVDAIHFEYNESDVAYEVRGCDGCPTAPHAARVRVLETGPSASRVRLQEGDSSRSGWVPNDWLANSGAPIRRRESDNAKNTREEAETFVGVSSVEVQRRLGTPLKIRQNYSDIDGEFETWIYDETRDKETFFIILKRDGVVSMGAYKGRNLTKYK